MITPRKLSRLSLLLVFFWSPVLAQPNDSHTQNHDWYQHLKQPGTGFSCCNGSVESGGDCRAVRARRDENGQWYADLDGTGQNMTPVPPRVVLHPSQNQQPFQAHVCASKSGMIYCFLEPQGGG